MDIIESFRHPQLGGLGIRRANTSSNSPFIVVLVDDDGKQDLVPLTHKSLRRGFATVAEAREAVESTFS